MRLAALGLLCCAACERAPEAEARPQHPEESGASAPKAAAPKGPAPKASAGPDVDAWPPLPKREGKGDRVYSKVRFLWIKGRVGDSGWIGYLSLGDSVPVKHGDAKRAEVAGGGGERCDKWYAVEPVGYVCTGTDATLDPRDPLIVELSAHRADPHSAWPYDYGESLGTPLYHALPTRDMQLRREEALDERLAAIARGDKRFEGIDLKPTGKGPPKLLELELPPTGRPILDRIIPGSTIAYHAPFDHEGRSFFVTWDRAVVPRDRVRPYPRSSFHGVVLDGEQRLPIAFFRSHARPKYERTSDGFKKTGKEWARLAWVGLTGTSVEHEDERYYETREPGVWVAGDDAAIAKQADSIPAALPDEGRRTWIDISVLGGTLVAYEGNKPVYATLISPGRGGVPLPDVPPLETASTPLGTYPVVGKFHTATMFSSSNSDIVHTEVMYTQNFSGPYALHGAYWHNDWGDKKSGGCVNLSPIDSRRIFRWTEPALPEGWHGMRTMDFVPKTLVSLRR